MFVSFSASRMKDFLRQLLILGGGGGAMFKTGIMALKLKPSFVEFFLCLGCFPQVVFFAKVIVVPPFQKFASCLWVTNVNVRLLKN